ncbi:MAG: DUF6468 domain-containing protein [Caulobacter sp.]|nr:DUF6468 domain-containing protein [Caulobacter sp.]
MSIAALALNLLLTTLLLAALALGWRLERRLKALKDSHDSFARAVADLDVAAARAEQGLADLRAATDEAAESLSDRIETAKALAGRLEKGVSASSTRLTDDDLVPAAPVRERAAFVRSEPVATPRSRARVDDDLFEPDADGGRLRAINGGRR